uniref:probable voltage-dependent R-type calcium channel subunit alpha-1E isoform X3 n=1 Tax=Ciona intestinalis TaxID=7719 RepID=UPI000EF4AD8F|nr:probable voltage-dependent R-type calcium channel subunit alpha-1E isoform X3 [Ciona intestinalis]|eukprot:XP_026695306.1 probable voltage-dependent R-type calcium channel subunit alpha-1E isoform X3 [Ciona intestinalis]
MNMPINEEKQVHFTTTLLALIRTSLKIKMLPQDAAGIDKTYRDQWQLDQELRQEIRLAWPNLNEKKMNLLLPPEGETQFTVGKVYGAMLVYEHWRAYKSRRDGKNPTLGQRPNIFPRMAAPATSSNNTDPQLDNPPIGDPLSSQALSMVSIVSAASANAGVHLPKGCNSLSPYGSRDTTPYSSPTTERRSKLQVPHPYKLEPLRNNAATSQVEPVYAQCVDHDITPTIDDVTVAYQSGGFETNDYMQYTTPEDCMANNTYRTTTLADDVMTRDVICDDVTASSPFIAITASTPGEEKWSYDGYSQPTRSPESITTPRRRSSSGMSENLTICDNRNRAVSMPGLFEFAAEHDYNGVQIPDPRIKRSFSTLPMDPGPRPNSPNSPDMRGLGEHGGVGEKRTTLALVGSFERRWNCRRSLF